jgi:hypothetical protein
VSRCPSRDRVAVRFSSAMLGRRRHLSLSGDGRRSAVPRHVHRHSTRGRVCFEWDSFRFRKSARCRCRRGDSLSISSTLAITVPRHAPLALFTPTHFYPHGAHLHLRSPSVPCMPRGRFGEQGIYCNRGGQIWHFLLRQIGGFAYGHFGAAAVPTTAEPGCVRQGVELERDVNGGAGGVMLERRFPHRADRLCLNARRPRPPHAVVERV